MQRIYLYEKSYLSSAVLLPMGMSTVLMVNQRLKTTWRLVPSMMKIGSTPCKELP